MSVGQSLGWSVCPDFLNRRKVTLPCSSVNNRGASIDILWALLFLDHLRMFTMNFNFARLSNKITNASHHPQKQFEWKWNFPTTPHDRLSVGLLVCHNFLKGREVSVRFSSDVPELIEFVGQVFELGLDVLAPLFCQ